MMATDRKGLLEFLEKLNAGQKSVTYTGYLDPEHGCQEHPPRNWAITETKYLYRQLKGVFHLCRINKTSPILFFYERWEWGVCERHKRIGGKGAKFPAEIFSFECGPADLVDVSEFFELLVPIDIGQHAQMTTRLKSAFLSTLQIGGKREFTSLPDDSIIF